MRWWKREQPDDRRRDAEQRREPAGERPDFKLVAYQGDDVLGGHETTFSTVFNQGKPVVLNFFAGQCPPCQGECH